MSDDEDREEIGCCRGFWGPFRPFLGGHSVVEAGASWYAPTSLLLVTRFCTSAFILSVLIYYLVTGEYSLKFYTQISFLVLAISFLFLALCSLFVLVKRTPPLIASIAVPLHQVAACAAVYLTVVYWIFIYDGRLTFPGIAPHAINVGLVVIDFALGSATRFRLFYILFFVLYTLIYVAALWIYYAVRKIWIYDFLDTGRRSTGSNVVLYVVLVAWALADGLGVFVISRLFQLFMPQSMIGPNAKLASHDDENPRIRFLDDDE